MEAKIGIISHYEDRKFKKQIHNKNPNLNTKI